MLEVFLIGYSQVNPQAPGLPRAEVTPDRVMMHKLFPIGSFLIWLFTDKPPSTCTTMDGSDAGHLTV
jgi:hypothetical protein